MNGEYMSLETAKKIRRYNILVRKIKLLKKENEKLHNIISDAKDYIELIQYNESYGVKEKDYLELLDILDKESKDE